VRNDFLRHKVLRGNMMVPGETVEIAGQTFGPACPESTWYKPIELTACGNIVPGELFFWGVTHEHD